MTPWTRTLGPFRDVETAVKAAELAKMNEPPNIVSIGYIDV